MFDFSTNGNCVDKNSGLGDRDTRETWKSNNNDLISSPTFLVGMSHEMRTHMNAIVAFSYLLKENSINNSENEEYSNQITRSCEQLIGLFDSFLDSALIDTGNSKSDLKICNLDNFLDDLLLEFKEAIKKEDNSNLELQTEIQHTNSTEVSIDANRLFRVIQSLFHNSLKNTKSGYIKIGYSFKNDKLIFHVLDSGNGFFKSKAFFHSDDMNESLAQHNDPYSAINISLARKLIQMLGGTIQVERNDIAGTAVYFSVPVRIMINSSSDNKKYINSIVTT